MVVAAGTLTVFACLGLGRFALGMLLPSMGAALGLSYAEMGFVSTGNFAGYLAAVLAAGWLAGRLGYRWTIALGLLVVAASMMLISRATAFVDVLALYVLTGAGSGAANVPIMALVSIWFDRRHRGRAAGWIVIGSGFGIVVSGQLVPVINVAAGADGWRYSWLVLGAIVLVVALICAAVLRNRPGDLSLQPFGGHQEPAAAAGHGREAPSTRAVLRHLGAIYFLFGASYPIYATFIVTSLVQDRGFAEAIAGTFWTLLGILSLASGQFGTLSDRIGRRNGLITVFALHLGAYSLAAAALPGPFLYLSIALFGICAWSIPSIMAAAVGDYMGPERAATAFGVVTFFFGIGQIVGPAAAGIAADAADSFAISFALAAALALAAILLTLFLRRPVP